MKFLIFVVFLFSCVFAQAKEGDRLRYLPVQDGGRIKPFDSFSREILQIIYGKQKYNDREAYEIVMTWMLSPQDWQDRDLFELRHKDVISQLKLSPEKRWFTGKELFDNEAFPLLSKAWAAALKLFESVLTTSPK